MDRGRLRYRFILRHRERSRFWSGSRAYLPLCRSMGGGLWEVRSNLPSARIARVLFCVQDDELVALHGFIKKTEKTPDAELKLARKRMKEVKRS